MESEVANMVQMPTGGHQFHLDVTNWPEVLTDILFKTGQHVELVDDDRHGKGKMDNKEKSRVHTRWGEVGHL